MENLPDVNVWLSLLDDGHVHHPTVLAWWCDVGPGEAAFCRITQMSVLRLLTNARVMNENVLTPKEAWQLYEKVCHDDRVGFLQEPEDLEIRWQALSSKAGSAAMWTDTYLAAFACGHEARVVTLDQGFKKLPSVDVLVLGET